MKRRNVANPLCKCIIADQSTFNHCTFRVNEEQSPVSQHTYQKNQALVMNIQENYTRAPQLIITCKRDRGSRIDCWALTWHRSQRDDSKDRFVEDLIRIQGNMLGERKRKQQEKKTKTKKNPGNHWKGILVEAAHLCLSEG